jgi:peptidoglycan glycosyltransferase
MSSLPPITPERQTIFALSKVLMACFGLVAVSLVFWGAIRANTLIARDDNPRGLEAEARIQRGALVDRTGAVFALNEGPEDDQTRRYLLPQGGHVIGYTSVLHGTAGAEAGFDFYLRGESGELLTDWWRDMLHLPQIGRDVQLAIDYEIQREAVEALQGSSGGALLLELPREPDQRARIRALASMPDFDANNLDDTFEALGAAEDAPLLNRVTQGQYQPGLLLQPMIVAAAVDQGIIRLTDPVENVDRAVRVNGSDLHCAATPPEPATWSDMLASRCPGPMLDLADQLGSGGLDTIFAAFGLDRDPDLELDTETTPDQPLVDPLLAGIGQENLSVTPLQIGLALGALANEGVLVQSQIGSAIADDEGSWQPWEIEGEANRAVGASAARAARLAIPEIDGIREFSPLVLSGPEGSTNTWYTGIWSGEDAVYVAVVILENSDDQAAAEDVGRAMLDLVR